MAKTLGVGVIGAGNISAAYFTLAPLFRGIDIALQSLDIMATALGAVRFRPERITLDPAIRAAEEANALAVAEGIPFREAYRRVGARLRKE